MAVNTMTFISRKLVIQTTSHATLHILGSCNTSTPPPHVTRHTHVYLVLNGLIPFLDLLLQSHNVLLQGPDDDMQLLLLPLQPLNLNVPVVYLLLQAVELLGGGVICTMYVFL